MDQGSSAMTSYPPKADLENNTSAEACTRISSPAPRAAIYTTRGTALPHMLAPAQQRTYAPPLPLLAPETAAAAYLHESASIGTVPTSALLNNNPPRYPGSSQRSLALHQHHHDHVALSNYGSYHPHPDAAPAYLDGLPTDFHAHPGSISGQQQHTSSRHRYPSIATATTTDSAYPSNFHTPFSSSNSNLSSPAATYHLPPMGLHLPLPLPLSPLSTEPLEVLNYRDSMRGMHTDLQPQPNDDAYRRPTFHPPPRLSHSQDPSGLYSDNTNHQPIAQIASRCRSTATSDLALMDSPLLAQYRHQQLTPLVYDSSVSSAGPGASYPGSSGGSHHSQSQSHPPSQSQSQSHPHPHLQSQSHTQSHTHAQHLYRPAHASSSIPMSNSHAESANNNNNANHHRRGIDSNNNNQHANDDHRRGIGSGHEESCDAATTGDDDDYGSKSKSRCIPQGQSVRAVGYGGYASRGGALDTLALARFDKQYNDTSTRMPFASLPTSATHSPLTYSPLGTGTSDTCGSDGFGVGNGSDEARGMWQEEEDEERAWESRYRWESRYQAQHPMEMESVSRCMKRKGLEQEWEEGVGVGGVEVGMEDDGGGNGNANNVETPLKKKKKKAKMHECAVCSKKFPRPSGLKTHMNTHSNEKPFPCGFPGCTRTFGVRSNAKRHLRTHGLRPTASINAATNKTPPPYVVGFEPPLVLPAPPEAQTQGQGQDNLNPNVNDDGRSGGSGGSTGGEILLLIAGAGKQERSGAGHKRDTDGSGWTARQQKQKQQQPQEKSPQREFKLRWMPPSLTSRTSAAALREVEERDERDRDGIGHESNAGGAWPHGTPPSGPWRGGSVREEEAGGGDGTRQRVRRALRLDDSESDDAENTTLDMNMDVDCVRGPYSDMTVATRLSIPFRPVVPSLSSVSVSGMGLLGTSTTSTTSSNNSSTSSFVTHSSTSTSISVSPPLMLERRKSSISEFDAAAPSSVEFGDERNSHMEVGSYPYHPSQFRALPGPAPTSAVAPLRSYMVV